MTTPADRSGPPPTPPETPSAADPPSGHVEVVVPTPGRAALSDVLADLVGGPVTPPFAPTRLDFVADFARALSRRGRGLPETQALAFWMRRAELMRMSEDFGRRTPLSTVAMPRGTVFHIPPANVDTLFVYSLVLSILAGNRNVVRLSSRSTDQSNLIVTTLNALLTDHPEVARSTVMVRYGHELAITAAISAQCDTRVIWGGDDAVAQVRQAPLPPHGTELTFPDRFSMAAINTSAYAQLEAAGRDGLAERFFNDAYWFDQLGCSSARLLVWVGEAPSALAEDFHARVRAVTERKGYAVDASAALAKLSQATRSMIDDEVSSYRRYDNSLTILEVAEFPQARGEFCGAGLFYQMHLDTLADLAPHITRSDQTLAVFGIDRPTASGFVEQLCGRGIDRIVPFGQALAFNRIWDGYDILAQLVRLVTVDVSD